MGPVLGIGLQRVLRRRLTRIVSRGFDQAIERTGPALAAALKDGQPTQAALGFARSCGVEFSAIGQKDGKLHFTKTAPGRATAELLPEIFEETLKQMDELVPKRMRWGASEAEFVRPVHWVLMRLGDAVLPARLLDTDAGATTRGHRFHAPQALVVPAPSDYAQVLREQGFVIADFAERRARIREAHRRKLEKQRAALLAKPVERRLNEFAPRDRGIEKRG